MSVLVSLTLGWMNATTGYGRGIAIPNPFMTRFNMNGKGLTFTGVIMSDAIARNTRGENPDVPMGLISRFPMLDDTERAISYFHVYCAIILMVVLYGNFIGPKGTDPDWGKARFHMGFGRIFSWLIAPHYALVGLVLNYYAITGPNMEDWLLGTDITGWRAQMAYITPFGLNVLVCTFMGFFLNRYPFMRIKPWTFILKAVSLFSLGWWFTIGVYMQGSQVMGNLGSFGLPIEKTLDGAGKYTTENQGWFDTVAFLTLNAGMAQAGFDFINYKVLVVVSTSGNKELAWKDMHKWAMINLAFQAGFIFGFFVAIFPYCVYGFPEWTCLPLGAAAPIAVASIWPFLYHIKWVYAFVKALLGGEIAEFSKENHKWDGELVMVKKALPSEGELL